MKKDMHFTCHFDKTVRALNHGGAFLVAENLEGRVNLMTIGWGTLGMIWGRPIFTVMVRKSRNTYETMNKGGEFTVNVPVNGLKKELLFCGTKSGRDYDKVKETGLDLVRSKKVGAPIIDQCQIHYECVIKNKKQLQKDDFLSPDIIKAYYSGGDYHMVFFGEIVASCCDEEI